MSFVMTVRTERDAVIDIVVTGNNVMYLDAVQPTADATAPPTVGEELFRLRPVKAHIQLPPLPFIEHQDQPLLDQHRWDQRRISVLAWQEEVAVGHFLCGWSW